MIPDWLLTFVGWVFILVVLGIIAKACWDKAEIIGDKFNRFR